MHVPRIAQGEPFADDVIVMVDEAWDGVEAAMDGCLAAGPLVCAEGLATSLDASRQAFLQSHRVTPSPKGELRQRLGLLDIQKFWADWMLTDLSDCTESSHVCVSRVRVLIDSWRYISRSTSTHRFD